jgi:hypothetical protein
MVAKCHDQVSPIHNEPEESVVAESYRYECESVEGFIQQLAVSYVSRGYWFYTCGVVPERKDPLKIDAKLMSQYGVNVSKWTRARKKKAGQASVHYLRHERFWVLVATHGEGPFFTGEGAGIRDFRKQPLVYHGYSVSSRQGRGGGRRHASVRIERRQYLVLKAYFEDVSTKWSVERLVGEISRLPFARYAPVRNQFYMVWRAVNRKRMAAGLELVPRGLIPWKRRPVSPFRPKALLSEERGVWNEV